MFNNKKDSSFPHFFTLFLLLSMILTAEQVFLFKVSFFLITLQFCSPPSFMTTVSKFNALIYLILPSTSLNTNIYSVPFLAFFLHRLS